MIFVCSLTSCAQTAARIAAAGKINDFLMACTAAGAAPPIGAPQASTGLRACQADG